MERVDLLEAAGVEDHKRAALPIRGAFLSDNRLASVAVGGAAKVALTISHQKEHHALRETHRNEQHQNGDADLSYPAQHAHALNGKNSRGPDSGRSEA
jgi:hypothetical protein